MKFDVLNAVVGSKTFTFEPYERGTSGAFVYREKGILLFAPRLIASTATNDEASDNYQVQINTPSVVEPEAGSSSPTVSNGTDLVKTQLRFLATTSEIDRLLQIDKHIAVLQKYREAISKREKLYA